MRIIQHLLLLLGAGSSALAVPSSSQFGLPAVSGGAKTREAKFPLAFDKNKQQKLFLWSQSNAKKIQQQRPPPVPHIVPHIVPQELSVQKPLISPNTFLSVMAFLSAAGDVISSKRHGMYASMMTGNWLRMASSVAEMRWMDTFRSFSVICSYMIGIGLFRTILQRQKTKKETTSTTRTTTVVAPISMMIMLCGEFFGNKPLLAMPLLAMAGGLVNAATSHAAGGTIVFAMTGHMAKICAAIGDFFENGGSWNKGIGDSVLALGWFFVGTVTTTVVWNQGLVSIKPWFAILGLAYAAILSLHGLPSCRRSAPVPSQQEDRSVSYQPLGAKFTTMTNSTMVPAWS